MTMQEQLRDGEAVATLSKEETEEIKNLVFEDAALKALFDDIIRRKASLGKRISDFWRKISKEYFVDVRKNYSVDFETGVLRKGDGLNKEK